MVINKNYVVSICKCARAVDMFKQSSAGARRKAEALPWATTSSTREWCELSKVRCDVVNVVMKVAFDDEVEKRRGRGGRWLPKSVASVVMASLRGAAKMSLTSLLSIKGSLSRVPK